MFWSSEFNVCVKGWPHVWAAGMSQTPQTEHHMLHCVMALCLMGLMEQCWGLSFSWEGCPLWDLDSWALNSEFVWVGCWVL